MSISSVGGEQEIATFKGNSLKSVQAVRTHGGNSTAIYNFVYYSNKKLYAYYASQGSSSSYATGGYVYYEFIGTI